MEIKKDSWVIINKDYPPLASNYGALTEIAKQKQYPLKVYGRQGERTVCHIQNIEGVTNYINTPSNSLVIITEKEALKNIESINKNYNVFYKKEIEKLKQKRLPIDNKKIADYLKITRNTINCSVSFAKIVARNLVNNKSTEEEKKSKKGIQNAFAAGCCSFTKTSNDLLVYIPKTWLNHFGYNLNDLKSYISFLKKCDINFDAEILGVVDLHSSFSQQKVKRTISKGGFFIKEDEKAYEILLKGKDRFYHTYINFIFLRYIINSSYWNIPFVAMKLKKNMPKATHWQCLLLAHNTEDYGGYYSLNNTNITSILFNGNKTNSNTPKNIINLSCDRSSVNQACFMKIDGQGLVRAAILREDYEFLQKFLNEN